jgi:large subunit ribosomal protein L3
MAIGLIGRKQGMTRVFTDEGHSVPVSVIEVENNRVTQVKTQERDGYSAVQVTYGSRKAGRLNKAEVGLYSKAGVDAGAKPVEFRLDADSELEVGASVSLDIFEDGQSVDVTGVSKGKGFAGGVKRWNFAMQDATHGNSLAHRAPGSIGQCQTPGRVFKGKKMAGQMGNKQVTVQSLELVKVDADRSLLLVKGAIPGSTGSEVLVRPAVKAKA